MKIEKWYRINPVTAGGVYASSDIDGVRHEGARVYPGVIVPGLWFDHVPRSSYGLIFNTVDNGGLGVALPYSPKPDEYLMLYTVYPATVTTRSLEVITDGKPERQRWYRVPDNDHVTWGLQALLDVEGICKAGDVAKRGDVIPIQWFSALTMEQINRLCKVGMADVSWFDEDKNRYNRITIEPLLETYTPDPHEIEALAERFPGISQ